MPILRRVAKTVCALLRRNYGWREYDHQPTARFPRLSFAGNIKLLVQRQGSLISPAAAIARIQGIAGNLFARLRESNPLPV